MQPFTVLELKPLSIAIIFVCSSEYRNPSGCCSNKSKAADLMRSVTLAMVSLYLRIENPSLGPSPIQQQQFRDRAALVVGEAGAEGHLLFPGQRMMGRLPEGDGFHDAIPV